MSKYWSDDKVYTLGKYKVHTTKVKPSDPVKWYLELYKDGRYWESIGSKIPSRRLAAWSVLLGKKKRTDMTPRTNKQQGSAKPRIYNPTNQAAIDEILEGYYKWCMNTVADSLKVDRILGTGKARELKPSEAKQAIEEYATQRAVEAQKEAQDSHIGRLRVLRAWAKNNKPVFKEGERAMAFTIFEIDNEIRIVKKWQAQLRNQDKDNV